MDYFAIAASASTRWESRSKIRAPKLEKINTGKALEAETSERIQMRLERLATNVSKTTAALERTLENPPKARLAETIGLERVIGRSDFLDINFIELALAVARFVGRISIRNAQGRSIGYGTGFMVSPRLLLTNNHVLPDAVTAQRSVVEFDFQNDRAGRLLPVVGFRLDPATFFMTDENLDFSLVAVTEKSLAGVALQRYGWLPLIKEQGKALLGEPLNVIQHPRGEAKQIVLRSNELVDLFDQYAHYVADTEPGSSGSPVFNDQWEVVALHHSGVPKKDEQGRYVARDGTTWTHGMDPDALDWIANEGIRVSSLIDHISRQSLSGQQARLRDDLLNLEPASPLEAFAASISDGDGSNYSSISAKPLVPVVKGNAVSWTLPLTVSVQLGELPPADMGRAPSNRQANDLAPAKSEVSVSLPRNESLAAGTPSTEQHRLPEVPQATADEEDSHIDSQACDDFQPPESTSTGVESTRPWRLAEALKVLKKQIDAAYPGRSIASDGTIGDARHQKTPSDHNPRIDDGGVGVVTAFDITHDPAHNCDAGAIAALLHASRDPRIKYIIWNRRIANASPIGAAPAWAWRAYTGSNPHNKHCHVSVKASKVLYDDASTWPISLAREGTEANALVFPESDQSTIADIEMGLAAVGGTTGKPLFQALIEAQDAITVLLSRYAEEARVLKTTGGLEGARPAFALLRAEYADLFASCQISQIRAGEVAWHRNRLLKYRSRYEEVAVRTGAPWWFIGIVHALEASFNFAGHLHNGDPLTARTVQVPKGRPAQWNPPSDWVSSAVDAIEYEGYAGKQDWNLAMTLYRFESYNGFGYRGRGVNTPYLWSFSNHYSAGKFVRDGKFDPNAVSKQCGAAVMLKALIAACDVRLL